MSLNVYLKAVLAGLIALVVFAPSAKARQSSEIFALPPGPAHHSDIRRDPAPVNGYTQSDSPISTSRIVVDSGGNVGSHSSLALSSTDRPVISYYDINNADLKLAVCDNLDCASPTIRTLDSAGTVGQYTSLALTADDRPVVSYYDATNEDLKLAVCNDPTCSSHTIHVVDGDSNNDAGSHNSLALTSNGYPVISYYDASYDDLKLAVCSDPTCADVTIRTLDNAGNVGTFTALALDKDGRPGVSYHDETNGDLKLALCNNASCSSHSTRIVDSGSGNDVGQQSSLAINRNGHPVISYQDNTDNDLKLAVCVNRTCGNLTTYIVDSDGNVGFGTSLTLMAGNYPVIAYLDSSKLNLKVVACGDPTCSKPAITVVDGVVDDVGSYPSLVLDSGGRPVVSYYDLENDDLKLATCGICRAPTLVTVDNAGRVQGTSLALDSNDRPIISYGVSTDDDFNTDALKLALCNDPFCSSANLKLADSGGQFSTYNSLVLDNNERPVISYQEYIDMISKHDLKLAFCVDSACSSINTHLISNQYNEGFNRSLALNSSGHPVISHHQYAVGSILMLTICHNTTCSTSTRVEVDYLISEATSLAINSSDYPVVAYYSMSDDFYDGDLKLAVCYNPTCSDPTIRTIDSEGRTGLGASLALNSSDHPIISYYELLFNDANLKLAICNDPTCTMPILRTIDSGAGWPRSLALSSSGYPVIAYVDKSETLGNFLKLAVCESLICANPTLTSVLVAPVGFLSLALSSDGYPVISYSRSTTDTSILEVAFFDPAKSVVYLPIVTN